ncbi:PilZ domain-containing protein [Candidatus Omnitrophota bacterium]
MEEKRRFVRLEWPVVVYYKTLEEPCTEDQIVSSNISEGGVCFIVYERLPKETNLSIELQVPFDSMPIFVKGKVVWVKKVGEPHTRTFEVGVKFIEIEPKDQKRFMTYINNEIKERKLRPE